MNFLDRQFFRKIREMADSLPEFVILSPGLMNPAEQAPELRAG